MNGLTTIESKRRAVAPIIATLLMVAIAVVGGILIFVFTQGFFADEQVVGPTVDNIRIFGYNAKDVAAGDTLVPHNSGDEVTCNSGAADNVLGQDDCILIYVENLGDKPVAFQAVRIFGDTYTFASNSSTGGNELGANDCSVDVGGTSSVFTMLSPTAQLSVLEPNTQATLCASYSGSGNVKAGRTIPIQVETSNGQSSQINIINGAQRGNQ